MRPYLTSRSPSKRGARSSSEVDVAKLLASSAPVSWGALLNLLPSDKLQELLAEARNPKPAPLPPTISETTALQRTLLHAHSLHSTPADPPENMFAPFVLARPHPDHPDTPPPPHVHWAHVDSGSMVCLVHDGVVRAHPELHPYRKPWSHCVHGIGGRTVDIVGKLVGVPVSIGDT